MHRVFVLLFLIACAGTVWAGDAHVACVQNQLKALGLDPGPIDGLNGPKTRRALATHVEQSTDPAQTAYGRLPKFSKRTAVGWCREIAVAHREARKFMPSKELPKRYLSDEVSPEMRTHVWVAFIEARKHLAEAYGVTLASQVQVVAAVSPQAYQKQLRATQEGREVSAANRRSSADRQCGGGLGGSMFRHVMTFCGEALSATGLDLPLAQYGLTQVMLHEYVHHMQREFSYDKTPHWVRQGQKVRRRMGPAWMIEGTADYIEREYARQGNVPLFTVRYRARLERRMLRDIRLSEEVRSLADYNASYYAAYLLAERYGSNTLIDYWRAVGETGNWFTAFKQTYGMSVQDFEKMYSTLLDDPHAGFEFVSDEDSDGDGLIAGKSDLKPPQSRLSATN